LAGGTSNIDPYVKEYMEQTAKAGIAAARKVDKIFKKVYLVFLCIIS